ncbi:MAG: Ig-like domain-containing protein [Lachnospiraceae bacterium]|nr:Ig-like domain-containing protein [Lachnospiraceae bacterium]
MNKHNTKLITNALKVTAALTMALAVTTMTPCENVQAAKTNVSLNKSKAVVYVGKTVKLTLRNKKSTVKWKSSNKKVATVSKKGRVTGKKAGKTTITATLGTKKFKCQVTVKKKTVHSGENKPTLSQPIETTTQAVETTSVVETTATKNAEDVALLSSIIKEQNANGATLSEDLDSNQYTWNNDGRLTDINWAYSNMSGMLTIDPDNSAFSELNTLAVNYNNLTDIKLSKLQNLYDLSYSDNDKLQTIDVSTCNNLAIDTTWLRNDITYLNLSILSLHANYNSIIKSHTQAKIECCSKDIDDCYALIEILVNLKKYYNYDYIYNLDLDSDMFEWDQDDKLISIDFSDFIFDTDSIDLYPNNVDYVYDKENPEYEPLSRLKSLILENNNNIRHFTIAFFPSLKYFSFENCNNLEDLEILNCPALQQITRIHNYDKLYSFYVAFSAIKRLDVSECDSLHDFHIYSSNIDEVYVSHNDLLSILELELEGAIKVECTYNKNLTSIDYHCLPKTLQVLDLSHNNLSKTLSISGLNLCVFDCQYNNIESLFFNDATHINMLKCNNNNLNELDISELHNLTALDVSNNNISSLDLNSNMSLMTLDCCNNNLSELNFSENYNLVQVRCSYNKLSTLDFSSNTILDYLDYTGNNVSTLLLNKRRSYFQSEGVVYYRIG